MTSFSKYPHRQTSTSDNRRKLVYVQLTTPSFDTGPLYASSPIIAPCCGEMVSTEEKLVYPSSSMRTRRINRNSSLIRAEQRISHSGTVSLLYRAVMSSLRLEDASVTSNTFGSAVALRRVALGLIEERSLEDLGSIER